MNRNQLMLIARQAALLVPEVKQYLKHETIKALKGGDGSGNFGHAGRPGEVGGSAPVGMIRIQTESTGSYSGQSNYIIKGYTESGELAATLEYSVYQGIPHIDMVESQISGMGAGAELVRELAREYGYENIEWGMMTEDGRRLQIKLDKEYGFTREFTNYTADKITSKFNGTSYSERTKEFNASFSREKYNEVIQELHKIGVYDIDVDIAGDEVYITATLPEDKEVLIPIKSVKALNTYQGVRDDYWASVYDAVEGYLNSSQPITSFRNSFWSSMSSAFQTAFEYGYTEGGGEVPIDDDAQKWLDGAIADEKANITALFQTLKDKRGDVDAINEAFARAEGYSSTLDQIYSNGKTFGAKNIMLTFVGDDGKESCVDCRRLKGKRHRASWWIKNDLIPGSHNYECGGWNCEHYLEDDNGNRFTL